MSTLTKTSRVISGANSGLSLYLVQLSEEKTDLLPLHHGLVGNVPIKSSEQITYKSPLVFHEEISTEEWKKSLTYDERQTEELMREILFEFDMEGTEDNLPLMKKMVSNIISHYEEKEEMILPEETRVMIYNLIVRMAYDKLCLKVPKWVRI